MDEFKIRFNKLLVNKFGIHPNQIRPEANFTKDLGAAKPRHTLGI